MAQLCKYSVKCGSLQVGPRSYPSPLPHPSRLPVPRALLPLMHPMHCLQPGVLLRSPAANSACPATCVQIQVHDYSPTPDRLPVKCTSIHCPFTLTSPAPTPP